MTGPLWGVYWVKMTQLGISCYEVLGWGLLSKIHVKFYASLQGLSNMASDWRAALLPANKMLGLKIFVD